MTDKYQTRINSILTPEFRSQLKRFELKAKRSVTGDVLGNYKSAFKGSGLEYADLREYQPGDEVKHIHWKASARAGKTLVKYFEEERTVRILLAVDTSRSLSFGTPNSKHQKILEFSALTTFLARSSGDQIGLISFAGEVQDFISPAASKSQLTKVLTPLLNLKSEPKTKLESVLNYLMKPEVKKSIVFLISDFYDEKFERSLALASSKHEVVCILVEHEDEYKPPANVLIEYTDAESSGSYLLDGGSRDIYQSLSMAADRHKSNIESIARINGADFAILKSSPVNTLQRILSSKIRRTR